MVQLLRPLLDFDSFPTALVEDAIWDHAQRGLFFLGEHYRSQYTSQYQPTFQMFAVLHLTDVIARFFPDGTGGSNKNGPEAIQFGLEVLREFQAGLPVAGPLQEMLRKTAIECGIRLAGNLDELMVPRPPNKDVYRIDDLIDVCTRPRYVQPVEEIRSRYIPSFSADWASHSASFGFYERPPGTSRMRLSSTEERGARNLMQIRNLLNTQTS